MNRRDLLRIGALSPLGLSMHHLYAQTKPSSGPKAKAKSCILIWLDGGPSHLETWDIKPDAPSEVRGPFQSIKTSVPGIQISECLPRTAKITDQLAIVRSMTSPLGEHGLANHYLLTGYKPSPVLDYPSYGAVVSEMRGDRHSLPPYVAIPDASPMMGAGFLKATRQPFTCGGDPAKADFRIRDLDFYPGLDVSRMDRRHQYLSQLDRFQQRLESSDPVLEQAYRLITTPDAKRAFNLAEETDSTRQSYGSRTIGQSCLLARRLVERGVPFITVNNPGWDTHDNLVVRLKEGYAGAKEGVGLIPSLDWALSGLISDLRERGLLDETLVIAMGEFGRTPKVNTARGRDHWPRVFSLVMAGGGIRGGQVVGSSDRTGESPNDRPVTPNDLASTLYTLLGINPKHELHTADGRPVAINQEGKVIRELLA